MVEGKLSVGELVVLMTYIAAVYQPLQTLTTTAADLTQQLVNLSFSTELLAEDPEIVEAPDAKAIERARGRVTFENVSFVYTGRKRTLTDISFDVQPGKRRDRRPDRFRQVDPRQPDGSFLRSRPGPDPYRRKRYPRAEAPVAPRPAEHRPP